MVKIDSKPAQFSLIATHFLEIKATIIVSLRIQSFSTHS